MNNHKEAIYPTFLLYGSRGLGKTLSSRLFTQTINCLHKINYYTPCHKCKNCLSIAQNTNPDFVEIDAATYNGIDNIRTFIIDHSKYSPIHLDFRVYLIDEVHMLTKESFNSLLKTIEIAGGYKPLRFKDPSLMYKEIIGVVEDYSINKTSPLINDLKISVNVYSSAPIFNWRTSSFLDINIESYDWSRDYKKYEIIYFKDKHMFIRQI
jgi:Cdc6-like AAA superfamily ATPase